MPGDLRSLMQEEGVGELLARSGFEVDSARPTYVRVKPGELALVGVEAMVSTRAGEAIRLEGYLRTYADPVRAESLAHKWSTKLPAPTALGTGVRLLADGRTVMFCFPNDAKLPSIRRLLRTDKLKRILGDLVGLEGPVRGRETQLSVVRYKPERRFLARVSTRLSGGPRRDLFLRLFADRRGDRLDRVLRTLAARGGDALVPRSLGSAMDGRLSAEEAVGGEELANVARRDLHPAALAELVARLHATEFVLGGAARSVVDEATSARRALSVLAIFEPELAEPIRSLDRLLSKPPPGTNHVTTLHGDLHLHQVLVTPTGLRLVDLERVGLGDPLIDIGNMRAHLLMQEVDGIDDFTEEYMLRTTPRALRDLDFFTALGLIRRALLSFRSIEPERKSISAKALEHATEMLSDKATTS